MKVCFNFLCLVSVVHIELGEVLKVLLRSGLYGSGPFFFSGVVLVFVKRTKYCFVFTFLFTSSCCKSINIGWRMVSQGYESVFTLQSIPARQWPASMLLLTFVDFFLNVCFYYCNGYFIIVKYKFGVVYSIAMVILLL